MKKYISTVLWILLFGVSSYYAYQYGLDLISKNNIQDLKLFIELMIMVFVSGAAASGMVFSILFSNTSESLGVYKRELEKESIDKTESSSRIKVLESKIKVLEKALDDALNK